MNLYRLMSWMMIFCLFKVISLLVHFDLWEIWIIFTSYGLWFLMLTKISAAVGMWTIASKADNLVQNYPFLVGS